jgi:hypothetical protein
LSQVIKQCCYSREVLVETYLIVAVFNQAHFANITFVAESAVELVEEQVVNLDVAHGIVNRLKQDQ